MLTIEEYISQRRIADQIHIEDPSPKSKNLELCLNYVNDYFNVYLVEEDQKEINTLESSDEILLNKNLDNKIYMALVRFLNQNNFEPIENTLEFKSQFSIDLRKNRIIDNKSNPGKSYNVQGLGRLSLTKICDLDSRIPVIR